MKYLNLFFDLLFPAGEYCYNCGSTIKFSELEYLCCDCLKEINFIDNFCDLCGREVPIEMRVCSFCRENGRYFDRARAVFLYKGLAKKLLIKFKYYRRKNFEEFLSAFLKIYFREYFHKSDFDYIIPVPLSSVRRKERGFNQALLLARNLSGQVSVELLIDYLFRVKDSIPLYNLGEKERRSIVRGIFSVRNDKYNPAGSSVLLIDDIFTTGATVEEISRILKLKGKVKQVTVLTLATASLANVD